MYPNNAINIQEFLNPEDGRYTTAAISCYIPANLIFSGKPVVIAITDCSNQVKFSYNIASEYDYNLFLGEIINMTQTVFWLINTIKSEWEKAKPLLEEAIKAYVVYKNQEEAYKLIGKRKPKRKGFDPFEEYPELKQLYKNPRFIKRSFINHSGNEGGVNSIMAVLGKNATVGEGQYSIKMTDGDSTIELHGFLLDDSFDTFIDDSSKEAPSLDIEKSLFKLNTLLRVLEDLDYAVSKINMDYRKRNPIIRAEDFLSPDDVRELNMLAKRQKE